MQRSRPASCLIGLVVTAQSLLTACGSSSSKSDPVPVVVYGKINVKTVEAKDSGSYELTTLTQCKRNVDTGRVDVVMSQGSGKPGLTFAIKDYSASAKSYTCIQAADNQNSATEVGGKFDSCMVSTSVLAGANATTLNTYSMHRETANIKPFTYTGSCTIQVTDASPAIKGTIICDKLVQTQLEGAARNPINAAVTADLTADFNCTFQ